MDNADKIILTNEITKKINETNDFLASDQSENLVVSRNITNIGAPTNVRFDGSTELSGESTHSTNVMRQKVASCREAYENSGLIGNAIDLMVDFALEGFDIVHHNQAIQAFYQAWADRVNLQGISAQILKCYFRDGNVPVLSFRAKIKQREVDKLQKAVAKHSKKTDAQSLFIDEEIDKKMIPYAYHILDVLNIERYGNRLMDNIGYSYKLSGADLENLRKMPDPGTIELLKKAFGDDEYKSMIDNGYLPIDNDRLSMIFYKKDDFRAWSNPMLWRVINDLKFKKLLRDMDISVCESVMNTLTIIALGDTKNGLPPTKDIMEKLATLLKTPTKSKTIVWNDLIKVMAEYPPIDKILGKEKYEQVDGDLRAGIGIAEVVLNGQGNNYANSFLSVKTLMERLEGGRTELLYWLYGEVRKVAKAMGFKQPAWFKMHHMTLRDEEAEKRMILELVDRGMVSYETCVDRFGENFQIEMERMKREDDFRRKNEKKYPYTLVKTGKFGPMITDGPLPVFELMENQTVDEVKLKQGLKKPQSTPTQQGGQGPKGGRPAAINKPQKKTEKPRNKPQGQKTAASIFEDVFSRLEDSITKARGLDDSNKISEKDRRHAFDLTAKVIAGFPDGEISNKKIGILAKSSINNEIMDAYNKIVAQYVKDKGEYPSFEDLKDVIITSMELFMTKTNSEVVLSNSNNGK